MPMGLMVFYRFLGAGLLVLAAATLWEKYRTVHGARLLPGRILQCRKAHSTNPRSGAGGYRYLVEIYVDGERLELETNDAFWFDHAARKGKLVQVFYNPARPVLERRSVGTELLAVAVAAAGVALLLIH